VNPSRGEKPWSRANFSRKSRKCGERQEGRSPGEPWRHGGLLRAWRSFEGWSVAEGQERRGASAPKRERPQRGEPQDRLRGATNPQDARRRNPSRWWETTKAERDLLPGESRPKRGGAEARAEAEPSRSGRRAPRPMEGHLWKPHERRLEKSRQGREECVSRRGLEVVGGAASAAPWRAVVLPIP